MSAYTVSDNHLNVLVSWFMENRVEYRLWYKLNGKFGYMSAGDAPRVAYELYKQNVLSVNDRYNDIESDEQYTFEYIKNAKQAYGLAEIAGAIDCLEYQSCETDNYKNTDAYSIITAMRKNLLERVQNRELGDGTTWNIDELKGGLVCTT